MRKAAIAALVAIGSSLALYAGIKQPEAKAEQSQSSCCQKMDCCPMGGSDHCCQ